MRIILPRYMAVQTLRRPITYSGFENSEDASVLDAAPVASMGTDETSSAGIYDISLSAGSDNNYEITNVAPVSAVAGSCRSCSG